MRPSNVHTSTILLGERRLAHGPDELTIARTMRTRLIGIPGRLVNRVGRPTLRLPQRGPWANTFTAALPRSGCYDPRPPEHRPTRSGAPHSRCVRRWHRSCSSAPSPAAAHVTTALRAHQRPAHRKRGGAATTSSRAHRRTRSPTSDTRSQPPTQQLGELTRTRAHHDLGEIGLSVCPSTRCGSRPGHASCDRRRAGRGPAS